MTGADCDVAIVGGGISGLYTAWRLAAETPARVLVLEAAPEPGGRLQTFRFAEASEVPVELGGAGYSPDHRRVADLVARLGLPVEPAAGRPGDGVITLRRRTLRRSAITRRHLGPLFPFALSRYQQTRGQPRLLLEAAERLVPGATTLDRAGWQALRERGSALLGRPAETGLAEALGPELVRYIEGRAGLTLYTRHPSTLHALEWLVGMCRMSTDLRVPTGGYQRLPLALVAALAGNGVRVETGRTVIGIRQEGGGLPVALRVRHRSGAEASLAAGRVVMAMGRRGIEAVPELAARDAPGSPLAELLRQVEPHPMGRLALVYADAWWRRLGLGTDSSATDMPIGQVTFADDAGGGPGVAQAIFDGEAIGFWRSFAAGAPNEPGVWRCGGEAPLAREAHRQLLLLLGPLAPAAAPPLAAILRDWSVDPFGGAIHFWGRSADAGAAAERMLRPIPEMDLFVCGEAWSHCQGWVEGALERCDALLERWFGLQPRMALPSARMPHA